MRVDASIDNRLAKLVSLVLIFSMWEVFAHVKNDARLYPSLEHIIGTSLPSLGIFSNNNEAGYLNAIWVLTVHGSITLLRISVAMVIAVPSGVVFGLFAHYLRGGGPLPTITLTAIRSVPLLALIPLFAFWFGSAPAGIFTYIWFGLFVVVSSDSYEAAANLPLVYVQQAGLLGGSSAFIFRTVYLSGIQPALMGSIRNVLGLSWALALGAEYVSATSGLGYIVYQSYLYSDMGKLTVLALVYMGFGYGTFEATRRSLAAASPWISRG